MKALVLSAGFGRRLRPYTDHTPKSLFPVGGRPLLFHWINRLAAAGCEAVAVNTHHLGDRIAAAVVEKRFPVPVLVRHEPVRLGTGGALRNLADFWDDRPFLVANADVWTNLDPAALYAFHQTHDAPATLALWDAPAVNTVGVDAAGRITSLDGGAAGDARRLTFTGVQVLDPEILDWIPEGTPVSSIEAFRRLIRHGRPPRAWRPRAGFWQDVGTPERYRDAVRDRLTAVVFNGGPEGPPPELSITPIPGDASDRAWFRLGCGAQSAVLADHGIRTTAHGPAEADAFVDIGRHLAKREVAVPRILAAERFAGLVVVEDLGSAHLEDAVRRAGRPAAVEALYRAVIDAATDLWVRGPRGFDPRWCYQTPRYDRSVVMAEGAYFVEGFLKAVCGRDVTPADFAEEFACLADRIAETGTEGFLHRDLQSRNILIRPGGRPAFIDFQGGRIGPVQYDLASLLIDPYVRLPADLQRRLREGAARRLAPRMDRIPADFLRGYGPCALARNLQILGAFGTLSRVRGKPRFAAYIPAALASLREILASGAAGDYPRLTAVVAEGAP